MIQFLGFRDKFGIHVAAGDTIYQPEKLTAPGYSPWWIIDARERVTKPPRAECPAARCRDAPESGLGGLEGQPGKSPAAPRPRPG